MSDAASGDTNATVWKSAATAEQWAAGSDTRERRLAERMAFVARLLPFADEAAFTFVDLGAGTGAAARAVLTAYPQSQAILAEFSPQMISEGARAMASFAGRYHYVEFDMTGSQWPTAIPRPVDAVITAQCVHHLPDDRKQGLFGEIFARLAAGGWFVNFDPVRAVDPSVEATWQRVNDRLDPSARDVREHHSPSQKLRYENHVRYMSDLDRQLAYLRDAGFAAVDVYWKQLDYVIYAGCRPA